jgi:hypothetical protein
MRLQLRFTGNSYRLSVIYPMKDVTHPEPCLLSAIHYETIVLKLSK